MKKLFIFISIFVFTTQGFGQVTNVKAGLWSDRTVWSTNSLPAGTDDVLLSFDITVDIDAVCQSLTLNGHNLMVNPNVHLNILGRGNSPLLSKFIAFDTTKAAPFDTTEVISLYYDNAKRNTGMDQIYYNENHAISFQANAVFFYNGNDTLPYKRVVDLPINKYDEYITDTCFYFYTNGLLTRDSSIQVSSFAPSSSVENYKYIDNAIIYTAIDYHTNPDTMYSFTDTVYLKYENGNIVSQTYSWANDQDLHLFTYDNHPNPFYRTQAKIAIDNNFPFYSDETYIEDVFARNNAVEINDSLTYDYGYHYKYVYEYNANGYPRQIWRYNQIYPESSDKAIYIYKN